jgi:hypothetical protein
MGSFENVIVSFLRRGWDCDSLMQINRFMDGLMTMVRLG